ncbi:hypothetical protein JB92DRAFT_2869597 [Gautieria morchelliformis]|nr:hypothetical protein JB92DRAFT_2869597 [Gautieria morchelliformis]
MKAPLKQGVDDPGSSKPRGMQLRWREPILWAKSQPQQCSRRREVPNYQGNAALGTGRGTGQFTPQRVRDEHMRDVEGEDPESDDTDSSYEYSGEGQQAANEDIVLDKDASVSERGVSAQVPQQYRAEPSRRLRAAQPPSDRYNKRSPAAGHTEARRRVKLILRPSAPQRVSAENTKRVDENLSEGVASDEVMSATVISGDDDASEDVASDSLAMSLATVSLAVRPSPVTSSSTRTTRTRLMRRTPPTGITSSRRCRPTTHGLAPPVARRRLSPRPPPARVCTSRKRRVDLRRIADAQQYCSVATCESTLGAYCV